MDTKKLIAGKLIVTSCTLRDKEVKVAHIEGKTKVMVKKLGDVFGAWVVGDPMYLGVFVTPHDCNDVVDDLIPRIRANETALLLAEVDEILARCAQELRGGVNFR